MPLAGSKRQGRQEGRRGGTGEADSCQLAAWWMTIWIMQRQQRLRQAASVDTIDWMIRLWFATAAAMSSDCNWSRQVEGVCSPSSLFLALLPAHALLMLSNRALSAATHAHTRTNTHAHAYTAGCAFNLLCSPFFALFPFRVTMATSRLIVYPASTPPLPLLLSLSLTSSLFICFLCSCFH